MQLHHRFTSGPSALLGFNQPTTMGLNEEGSKDSLNSKLPKYIKTHTIWQFGPTWMTKYISPAHNICGLEQVPNIVSRREIFGQGGGPELALRFPAFCFLIDRCAAFSSRPQHFATIHCNFVLLPGTTLKSKYSEMQNAILCEAMYVHYSSGLPLEKQTLLSIFCDCSIA